MNPEGVLQLARSRAEDLMVDECDVGTEERGSTMVNGKYPIIFTPVYSGRCLLVGASTQPTDVDSGGVLLVLTDSQLKLPVATSTAVRAGMIAKVRLKHDPGAGEVRVRVKAPHHETYAKERRFPVEEVT